jgi:AcrR family transcriptional regulator
MKNESKSRNTRVANVEASNDAERSKADIITVATDEFATRGLSGARVDAIAERTRTSKRMIYYYFGSKKGLYRAVIDNAYSEIRSLDSQVDVDSASAVAALGRFIEITFDYDEDHPQFIRLLTWENMYLAQNIATLPAIKQRNAAVIRALSAILTKGRKEGVFRKDVSPLDLHLLITSLCYYRVSNRYTFGLVFNCDLSDPSTRKRHKKMIVDAVLRFLGV